MAHTPTLAAKILAALPDGSTTVDVEAVRTVVLVHLVEAETATLEREMHPTTGTDLAPALSVLAEIAASMELIAENTAHATEPVTVDRIERAWESLGQRANEDIAVALVRALGVPVDE